uniref:N-acetyltransferase domain-containing protein n=1 Tax=Candidatus Kentrum sp. UNK TaxID=2126344 RepID=A0A451AAY3_9GAMM|nr:MAG: hypothetical protein BECKUNK1418G_GA0071005_103016 [Candidatus Kentron sp. UNK]VFK71375.1 MAG: hypothetical protein BECKUNK1418H_GA0071006_10635 [Candidatus Kentron sp. UNK]
MVLNLNAILSRVRRGPDGPAPALLMVGSMIGLLAMFSGFLLAPLPVALLLGVGIYALLGIAELSQGIVSPITQTSLFLFVLSALAFFFGSGSEAWIPYMGSLFLGALFIVSAGFLAAGRPFTVFYSADRGHRVKHWVVSGLWTLAYFTGSLLAFLLMPDVSFVYAPMLILVGAAVLTLVFNLLWFGAATRHTKAFEYKGFRFAEIGNTPELLTQFYNLAAKEFWPSVRYSSECSVHSLAELRERLQAIDQPYENRILRFMAWMNTKPIGIICCIFDDSRVGLPVEKEASLRIDELRRAGKVMEIGKFAIASGYRAHQSLFLGLLRCVIDVALEHQVSFVISDSYVSQTELYRKIGFSDLAYEPFRDANGAECVMLALNLSMAVVYESNRKASTTMNELTNLPMGKLTPLSNNHLAERCYHRLVLRYFWRQRQRRPYDLLVSELRIGV